MNRSSNVFSGSVTLSANRSKWLQIAVMLRSEIELLAGSGEERLPTESELSERFSVSLMTVRQALAALESDGLIERRRKFGTFITPRASTPRQIMMLGELTDVFEQQKSDTTRVIRSEMVDVPDNLADFFAGQRTVRRLVRSRTIDQRPCNLALNHMRLDVFEQIDPALLTQMPVSQVIHEHTPFAIARMDQELSAQLADPVMAGHLQIEPLDPVMVVTGTGYDCDGRVLDTAKITYRADLFRFRSSVMAGSL